MTATAKLFMHGRSQAVRLPKEFRMPGMEVRISKVGNKVVLEPMAEKNFDYDTWRAELDALGAADFLTEGTSEGPPEPKEENFDLVAWNARLDSYGSIPFMEEGEPDDPPAEPDDTITFD